MKGNEVATEKYSTKFNESSCFNEIRKLIYYYKKHIRYCWRYGKNAFTLCQKLKYFGKDLSNE